MQSTKFTITLTAPLVITADGDFSKEAFSGDFPQLLQSRQIRLESKMVNAKDNDRIKDLKGDLLAIAFTFTTPVSFINTLCNDIAHEIFQNAYFSPDLRILVESTKSSSVIALSGINARDLAKKIQEIITAV